MKIVYVEWEDTFIETAHITFECARKITPIKRINIGFVYAEDKKNLWMCFGVLENYFNGETATDMAMVVPKRSITKMECIKEIK